MACKQHPLLLGRGVCIDNFTRSYRVKAKYFCVSHAHSDHLRGLSRTLSADKRIVCSAVTKHLLRLRHAYLPENMFIVLRAGEKKIIAGFTVQTIPSYHCDGSVMFLFTSQQPPVSLLITSDYRWRPQHSSAAAALKRVRECWFDDTLSDLPASHSVPAYEDTLHQMMQLLQSTTKQSIKINCSILGLEPILRALALKLNMRFTLSAGMDTQRAQELRYLLPNALTTGKHSGKHAVLAHRRRDTMHPEDYWIIPSCTYTMCKYKRRSLNPRHIYVPFCTHASPAENTELKKHLHNNAAFFGCESRIDIGSMKCNAVYSK